MDCSLDSEHIPSFKKISSIITDITKYKMSKFLHDIDDDAEDDTDDDAKAIAIPQVFSENSQAKNLENKTKIVLYPCLNDKF